uniref:Putative secreted protein n=1 Tax=Amblyomma aureolatum TaxID=187763 RepID=A0A1E1WX91_9ACAR
MRALVACLALFLAVAVLHCEGRKKRNAEGRNGDCDYEGYHIKNGGSKNLTDPCEQVKCKNGNKEVTKCPEKPTTLEERKGDGKQGRKGKKGSSDNRRKKAGNKGRNPFPECCDEE